MCATVPEVSAAAVPASQQLTLKSAAGRWVVAAAVLGSGMASLDATVVNIALPALGQRPARRLRGLQWPSRLHADARLAHPARRLAGRPLRPTAHLRHRHDLVRARLARCARSRPSIEILVAARALQGVGGALLTPGSLAMIQASFVEDDRGRAIGAWSGFGGVATAIGPFVGGYLVAGPGWRWVFLINLPLALLVVLVAAAPRARVARPERRAAPRRPRRGARRAGPRRLYVRPDRRWQMAGRRGARSRRWPSASSRWSPLASTSGAAASPMVPPDIFANPQFTAANIETFVVYAALSGLFFFLVVDLQVVAGFSPVAGGHRAVAGDRRSCWCCRRARARWRAASVRGCR